MKKCPVCGVEHSDIISVCSICGSPLTNVASTEPAEGFSPEEVQATVSSVVSATVDASKQSAPQVPDDVEEDSPFVINAMREPSASANEVKSSSRSESAPSQNSEQGIDTTQVAAVSAQKVYEATQNAINARNAQAAANAKQKKAEDPEQVEWSQRRHKRKSEESSNGLMIAACVFLILVILAILIFVGRMIWGGNSNSNGQPVNPSAVSDVNDPDGNNTNDQQGGTTILPDDGNGTNTPDDGTDTPDDNTPDGNTPDSTDNSNDPDASVIDGNNDNNNGGNNDAQTPDDQPDQNTETPDDTQNTDNGDDQPVVVPTELPAITDTDDTVYATAAVNVRDYPNAQTSNVINVLSQGQSVKRTGTTANGWSRVVLADGKVGYVSNRYLSTSKDGADNNNNAAGNVAYANTDVNVRTEPHGDIIGALPKGTEVKLTGVTSGSWTQVTANGMTGYVYSPYLTRSGDSTDGNTGNNTELPKVTVKETNDTVYAISGVNIRDYPSATDGKVIGTLSQGQSVKRIGTVGKWSQITVGNLTGYVYNEYISTSKDGGNGNKTDNNNNNNSGKSGGYILPDSATRNYTKDELSALSASQLRLARNEIYARHGRKFSSSDLKTYFEGKSWYSGTVDAATFDANVGSYLNSYELANLKLIQELEGN